MPAICNTENVGGRITEQKPPSKCYTEKEMATHSSVLAWRIPGMGSLAGCRLWGRTESDTTEAT